MMEYAQYQQPMNPLPYRHESVLPKIPPWPKGSQQYPPQGPANSPFRLMPSPMSSIEHHQKPASLNTDTSTYTCTYHGCTLRFETPQKLQKHKREGHRSAGPPLPSSSTSRGVSPFRRDSPYQPDNSFSSPRMRVGTAAQTPGEDVKADSTYADEPKTISPKDALLDYHDVDDESKMSLFPGGGVEGSKWSQSLSSSISRGVSPTPVTEINTPRLEKTPNGFPRLAAFQSSEANFSLYRSFSYLHSRILLDLQDDITCLEKELEELDWDDHDENPARLHFREADVATAVNETPFQRDSRYQPDNSFNSHRIKGSQVFEIPSYLAQIHRTNALGDYCAKYNFMREEYALRLGLSINRQQKIEVTIGSGKMVSTVGTATTTFQFGDEVQSYPLVFHLLPSCIHNLILGRPFLKATRTFSVVSNFVRRVKTRMLKGITQNHLLYLSDSTPKFQGLINGIPQDALADSGAKVMIMDEDYALSRGLSINTGTEYKTKLRFADNSTAYTSGMIHGVSWEFGQGGDNDSHILDFHVLKRAPASVILSDTFLFGTEAFSKYNCYLVDDDDIDEEAYFFAIDIDKSSHGFQLSANVPAASARYIELIRRGEAEDTIAKLPTALQNAAQVSEDEQRAQWDRLQATLQLAPQNALPPSVSSTTNSQVPSNQTSASSSSGLQQQSSVLHPKSRGRWRLKLKLKSAA